MNTKTPNPAQIADTLQSAERAIDIGQWMPANVLLKRGLLELGDSYARPDATIDDSGMKLVLADMEEKKGNFEGASAIRRRILAERLKQLREKIAADTGAAAPR